MRVGSVFTGIGGADLGLERAGHEVAWQCESDPWKTEILRAHWPGVPVYPDISAVEDPPPVDLLVGGFPCQDLSVAGRRLGFAGERSVLAFEFLRLAEHLRPRWLVLENVPGLLTASGGRDFARLVDEVVNCGYGLAWRILDAQYFGVAQRRRRIFIVARASEDLADPRDASRLALRVVTEGGGWNPTPGWPPRPGDAGGTPLCTRAKTEPVTFYSTGGSHQGFARVDGLSPTLKRGSTGGIGVPAVIAGPDSVRRFTPEECEVLTGLPKQWTAPPGVRSPDGRRYAACGDAVVATVAHWLGLRLRIVDALSPTEIA